MIEVYYDKYYFISIEISLLFNYLSTKIFLFNYSLNHLKL